MKIIDRPSPNFNDRRHAGPPDMVVLHYTAMDSEEAALARLCAPEFEVSAHYLIGGDGRVWQLVADEDRAWHAGQGAWGGIGDVNSHSLGIELANSGNHPFPEPQMAALDAVLADRLAVWSIPPSRVIGHSDMAPDRKSDPGPRFDWRRLALRAVSVWPDTQVSADDRSFGEAARVFGYRAAPDLALRAFRQRFRPWATGPLCDADRIAMVRLATRHPCLDGPVAAA